MKKFSILLSLSAVALSSCAGQLANIPPITVTDSKGNTISTVGGLSGTIHTGSGSITISSAPGTPAPAKPAVQK